MITPSFLTRAKPFFCLATEKFCSYSTKIAIEILKQQQFAYLRLKKSLSGALSTSEGELQQIAKQKKRMEECNQQAEKICLEIIKQSAKTLIDNQNSANDLRIHFTPASPDDAIQVQTILSMQARQDKAIFDQSITFLFTALQIEAESKKILAMQEKRLPTN